MRFRKPKEPETKTITLYATHGSTLSSIRITVPEMKGPLIDDWMIMEIVLSLKQKGWAITIAP